MEYVGMRPSQIEAWAIQVIEQIRTQQRVEDARVELKTEWPSDANKFARQLAAHANAARFDPILWLIGVDERNFKIPGAPLQELANWWPQVQREFDDVAPTLTSVNVPVPTGDNGRIVVTALQFATDRPPYVVKSVQDRYEVPWREGERTRSARRYDLLRLLVNTGMRPRVAVLNATLRIERNTVRDGIEVHEWWLSFSLYFDMPAEQVLIFPHHMQSASLSEEVDGGALFHPAHIDSTSSNNPPPVSQKGRVNRLPESKLSGPGNLTCHMRFDIPAEYQELWDSTILLASAQLTPTGGHSPLRVELIFTPSSGKQTGPSWVLAAASVT